MALELVWLAKSKLGPDPVRMDEPVDDISIPFAEGTDVLYDNETRQQLPSGHQIILTTTDTENYPLSDEQLIKLQWLLTRVLRLSAAAGEAKDMEYDDSPTVSP